MRLIRCLQAHSVLAEVDAAGRFVRTAAGFREVVSPSHALYKPAAGRYHLYISHACPWANRCMIVLQLKGLQGAIGVSVVHPTWQRSRPDADADQHTGWAFVPAGTVLSSPTGMVRLDTNRLTVVMPVST